MRKHAVPLLLRLLLLLTTTTSFYIRTVSKISNRPFFTRKRRNRDNMTRISDVQVNIFFLVWFLWIWLINYDLMRYIYMRVYVFGIKCEMLLFSGSPLSPSLEIPLYILCRCQSTAAHIHYDEISENVLMTGTIYSFGIGWWQISFKLHNSLIYRKRDRVVYTGIVQYIPGMRTFIHTQHSAHTHLNMSGILLFCFCFCLVYVSCLHQLTYMQTLIQNFKSMTHLCIVRILSTFEKNIFSIFHLHPQFHIIIYAIIYDVFNVHI